MGKDLAKGKAGQSEIDAFLKKVAETPAICSPGKRGRLIFAMDATASRRPTWDTACQIQGEMFTATKSLGGLDVQLAYYRGFGEFHVGAWSADTKALLKQMTGVSCHAGETQIGKVLGHAVRETRRQKVNAVVFVGDSCEEDVDRLGKLAGELGLLGVPVFVFHEGGDPVAGFVFRQIAKLSGGACCAFDRASGQTLKDLLSAVAVFAAGGPHALEDLAKKRGGDILQIAKQVRR